MSRARHHEEHGEKHEEHREHHERGGQVEAKPYNAVGSEAVKEAEEKKAGGRIKRKRGGATPEGHSTHMRLDRPRRRSGGKIGEAGADMHPLSTASKVKGAPGHEDTMSGEAGTVKDMEPD